VRVQNPLHVLRDTEHLLILSRLPKDFEWVRNIFLGMERH